MRAGDRLSLDEIARWTAALRALDWTSRRALAAGLLLAVLALALAAISSARRSSVDEGSVLAAHWMLRSLAGRPPPAGVVESGRPPGYAIVLTGIALVTPGTRAALACWAEPGRTCRATSLPFVLLAQLLAAVSVLALSFRLAHTLSGDGHIALLATILAWIGTRPGEFAGLVRPHIWYLLLLILALALLTEAVGRRSARVALGAGAALGMAALFEPVAAVLVPVAALSLAVAMREGTAGAREQSGVVAMAALLAGALVAAFGLLQIAASLDYGTSGISMHLATGLAERMAFVGIERSTSLAMIATSIPVIGDLVSTLLPAGELRRIGLGAVPGSLAWEGTERLLPDALARGGGSGRGALAVLLGERLAGQPAAYAASLPSMLARGLFAGGGIVALIGIFHVGQMLRLARAEGRLAAHLLVLIPVATLLLANALLTGNAFWLNPALPLVYAYAIAYVAAGW
jgi:hypothetical protein